MSNNDRETSSVIDMKKIYEETRELIRDNWVYMPNFCNQLNGLLPEKERIIFPIINNDKGVDDI